MSLYIAIFMNDLASEIKNLGLGIRVGDHDPFHTSTRLGQLGANISPDRSSSLYELQHINLLCLYLPKEDGVSPDAEYITQIIFSIFLQ